jgi:RarD protein
MAKRGAALYALRHDRQPCCPRRSLRPSAADREHFLFHLLGLLPILFIWADRLGASAMEIVAWRVIWALPWAIVLVLVAGQGGHLRRLPRHTLAALLLSAALIAVNWSIYVWAVCSGRTISASLGYYLNPLLNMAAGAVLFKERIDRPGRIAIALAAVGVALQGWALGEFPWVSLGLAFSFCGYGIVRKSAVVEAQTGLLVECAILVILAAIYAFWLHHAGTGCSERRRWCRWCWLWVGPRPSSRWPCLPLRRGDAADRHRLSAIYCAHAAVYGRGRDR